MRKLVAVGCAAALCWSLPARADSVRQRLPADDGLRLETESGILQIGVMAPGIVHVTFGTPGYHGNYDPAVIARPEKTSYSVADDGDAFTLKTSALTVRVGKADAAITFLDSSGRVVLAEKDRDIGLGATQAFKTSATIYGLGQHQNGLLDYSGHSIHLQQSNGDVAIPMIVSPDGFGLLWNDAAATDVSVNVPGARAPLVIASEAGPGIDYDFILGAKIDDVIGGYRWLTGQVPMMARWTFGMWQSKEHYATQDELVSIPRRYRSMGIPIDAVVQDWQYWLPGQWGSHQFDPERYPDPKAMVAAIHAMHVHTIISVWPRFDLKTANLAELNQAGAVLPGVFKNVYPAGFGRWYDAWNARGRQIYWSQIMKSLGVLGFDGWWLDGDEAELGGVPGEIREESTAAGPGIAVNNSFPLVHTTAVHDGMRRDQPDKRVFLLSRSAYAGQQRNGAITWSGDTHASWETLAKQIPAALNFSMSGIPYWSADIGGFFSPDPHKDKAYVELFVRWHQFGVFTPMFRIHGSGQGKEIWNFDKPTQKILIDDVTLRYRLLPYLYSMAWDVSHDHGTMMRALAFDFADDARAVKATDEYLFGKAFLVAPVLHPGIASRSVYLPAGSHWFDFRTGAEYAGGQRVDMPTTLASIPVLVRDGSIVPLGPVKPYADAPSNAPIELRLYPGRDGDYALYNDSGDGYGYQHGAYTVIPIHWDDQRHVLEIAARKGRYPGMRESLRFRVTCGAAAGRGVSIDVTYSGKAKRLSVPACHI